MKTFWVICGLAFMAIVGCQGDEKPHDGGKADLINEMKKEVIAMHDEVMPKMGDIARLKENLETELGNVALDSSIYIQINERITALVEGDSLMWEWMHNFSVPQTSEDSVLLYLKSEKSRIDHVANKMHESINQAESLLLKLGHGQPN